MNMGDHPRLIPTGLCWCGCGAEISLGSFFAPGHDKAAEAAVILMHYGGVAEFLVAHGFGPEGRNPRRELERWRARAGAGGPRSQGSRT
jgi:hypothetical protein